MLAHQRDRPIRIARQRCIHDRSMLFVDVALGAGQGHGEAPVALGVVEQLRAQAEQPSAVASVYQREMEVGMPLQPPSATRALSPGIISGVFERLWQAAIRLHSQSSPPTS